MNYIDHIYHSMAASGIEFCGEILPIINKWQRFYSYQKDHGNKDVFVKILIPGKLAIYGDWNLSQENFIWRGNEAKLSKEEILHLQKIKKQKEDEEQKAVNECIALWNKASIADYDHPYIVRKKIYPYYIKQFNSTLLIPIRNLNGDLCSLQAIYKNGNKKIYPGTSYQNKFLFLGDELTETIRVVEGYATGMSVHMATDDLTVVSFSANNLKNVALIIRKRFPKKHINICCDNDMFKSVNKGIIEGLKAANAIDASINCPYFEIEKMKYGTDYNDLHVLFGMEALQGQLYSSSFRNNYHAK